NGRVDARDPQRAELALFRAAVAVGVLTRLHHRLLGDAIDGVAPAPITLGLRQDLLVPRLGGHSTLDSWHSGSLRVRHHGLDRLRVGAVDAGGATQVPLVLGALLREDMALERHGALDAAAPTDPESLLRAALRLHLGHDCFPYLLPTVVLSGGETCLP